MIENLLVVLYQLTLYSAFVLIKTTEPTSFCNDYNTGNLRHRHQFDLLTLKPTYVAFYIRSIEKISTFVTEITTM